MRRLVFPVIVAFGLVMAGPSSAFAEDPAPTVSVKATAGKKVCKITDDRLDELSGIVATKSGFIVVNDSTDIASHKKVFFLDTKCKLVKEVAYSGNGPRDTEDLVLSPDGGTLWIADIGDNNYNKEDGSRRDTIGVWTMPVDGSKKPQIHRLTYPEGASHDAEALLLTGDNIPLIVTKEIGKAAVIYQPSAALKTGNETGVPLKKVGELTLSATETPGNPYARIGNKTIDGGAVAPGGGKVVLRTYTDALEWDVSNNDVLAALKGKPRTTGLPNETLGEAITYSSDGKTFYTISDMSGDEKTANYILSYTPATTVAAVKKASVEGDGGSGTPWYSDLTINQIMYMVGGVGVLGLLLVAAGVLGIARHRKRLGSMPPAALDDGGSMAGDPETELIGVGGAPQRAGMYGAARSGPPGGGGGVYGGPAGQRGGPGGPGVYGGGGGGGGPQYGRPQGGQPRGPVYGSGGGGGGGQYGRPPQGQRPPGGGQRPPQGGQRPQGQGGGGQGMPGGRPQGGGGQGGREPGPGQRPQRPQGQGVYGQPGGRPDRPPQRGGDGYADQNARPDGRFDNPGYRR